MKYLLFAGAGWLMFISCSKKDIAASPVDPVAAETRADIAYGSRLLQKLDIYLPAGRAVETTKTLVLIHGGGWEEGDKSDMSSSIDFLKQLLPGYAIINVNYRLAVDTDFLFPTQETDIKSLLAWYLSNSENYHISRDLVLQGMSAGAHLALLHAYKNDPDHHVKAVVDFFGPADLYGLWHSGTVQRLILLGATGKSYDDDTVIYEQSSPVNFIVAHSAPTIVLQGGVDPLVPQSQATTLINKLKEKGVVNQLVYYPSEGHGWEGANLLDSFDKIQAFLKANVH